MCPRYVREFFINLYLLADVLVVRKQTLLQLAPAEMEASGRTECFPSTRQDILSEIIEWAITPSGGRNVLWLGGLASSGKSTLATTVANYFRDLGRLGAFVFFDRAYPERSHPSKVIRTLAYKLALFDCRIGAAICAAIDAYPSINDAPLRFQFTTLLRQPLESLSDLHVEGPIVLVLDAVDECGNPSEREALLTLLGSQLHHLPSVIRIFITGRQLDDLTAAFGDQPHIFQKSLEASSDGQDIMSYLEHQLQSIRRKKKWLSSDWPGCEIIRELGKRSCGLFVWASTAANYIDGFDPEKCLAVILQGKSTSGAQAALDELYKTALESAGAWNDVDFVQHFRTVFGTILVLQEPLTTSTLDLLLGLPEGRGSCRAVSALACLVAHEPMVHLLHPSFADFLLSRDKCGREIWHFDAALCHKQLALRCLSRLSNNGLRRNLCNLVLPVPLREETVPVDMAYACICWINHMRCVDDNDISLAQILESFLTKHLLHWLEAMSILRRSGDTVMLLSSLYGWTTVSLSFERQDQTMNYNVSQTKFPAQRKLSEFVRDAWRFVQTCGTLIEEHPLLIYFAALPFTPTSSTIYQTFHDAQMWPTISGGFEQSWSGLRIVLSRHTDAVLSAAFSPNGDRIVSGSADKTVRIWDTISGTEVIGPLRGHTSFVHSVAFSPDGKRVVSGSSDKTVRVWDTVSGSEVIPPILSPDGWVYSVAFSPDGTCIVSGSGSTVHVWDVASGIQVVPALEGHDNSVQAAIFSPDGAHIVSASHDKTLRLWETASGSEVVPPLRGHDSFVLSVAFSPDGTRIASGSSDKTIRIWDMASGTEVMPRLQGHDGWVLSVAFSSDGTRIVSGSSDMTIRVWDAVSGKEVIPRLRGHGGSVRSVQFSQDGTSVVSCSDDKTVRVWDTGKGDKPVSPLRVHKGSVQSVAFSPDGSRVVSGSADKTIRVWDATTGKGILPPLRGHRDWVRSVAFTPDGTRIVSGSDDKTLRVWDVASGSELIPPLRGHEGWVRSVAISADGTRIVSGGTDDTVRVWDIVSGKETVPPLRGHHFSINSVAFSPDAARVVAESSDMSLHIWDIGSGKEVLPPLRAHDDTIQSTKFSADGTRIICISHDKVRIWDATTGRQHVSNAGLEEKLELHSLIPAMISINKEGWLVEFPTSRFLCKLPPMIVPRCSTTRGKSLVIGTQGGQVLILNFPLEMFSNPETHPPET
jgi:WD40 repeat protein